VLLYKVARPCQISSGGGEGCLHGLKQRFFGDDYVPISGFVGGGQSTFGDNFGKFVFYNGEDGLSGSSVRHVKQFLRDICLIEWCFFNIFFGFLLFFFFSSSLFFIVQSVSSVTDHLFHLFLDCRKLCVRERDGDGDWVITMYQFEWGMNLFSVSSIVVCEFQSAEGM
jgi:hypothetical protein